MPVMIIFLPHHGHILSQIVSKHGFTSLKILIRLQGFQAAHVRTMMNGSRCAPIFIAHSGQSLTQVYVHLQAQASEKKASRKTVLDKITTEAFSTCLVEPFVEAAAAGDKPRACAAIAQAWLTYIRLLQVPLIEPKASPACMAALLMGMPHPICINMAASEGMHHHAMAAFEAACMMAGFHGLPALETNPCNRDHEFGSRLDVKADICNVVPRASL